MTTLHLVSGGDEARRRALVADLVLGTGAQTETGEGRSGPSREVLTWGSGLLGAAGLHGSGARVHAAAEHVPASWTELHDAADALLAALGLSSVVGGDLLAPMSDPDVTAVVGVASRMADLGTGALVVSVPPESDPSRVLALPARMARTLSELVPVLARWDALVAPAGVGALRQPAPHVLEAVRETATVLRELDAHLATQAHVHHLPGPGVLEGARSSDLAIALALMGRSSGAPPRPGGDDPPFVLRLPMPGLTAGDVSLDREGDELIVSAGRHRRTVPLSAMHRRCTVVRAGLAAGVLTVELEPDPVQWPATTTGLR